MRAIRLNQPGDFTFVDVADVPSPAAGQSLVRVHRVGICGTDLHAFRGSHPFIRYPLILGHELGVEVVEVGERADDNEPAIACGDKCSLEPYLNCGKCIACRNGKTNCCPTLEVLGVHTDGGMCSHLLVPTHKLHKSMSMSLDQLALVETLGIGAHAVDRASLQAGENVLVIGAGPIGLSVVQFAQLHDVRLLVADISTRRLAFCREHMTIARTLEPGDDLPATLAEMTDGDMPAAIFDATGNISSMNRTFGLIAPGGRIVFTGIVADDIKVPDGDFHRVETTLHATRNSTASDFKRIIRLIEEGCIDTTPWITHRSEFDDMIDAFPTWLDPDQGVVKAIVEIGA